MRAAIFFLHSIFKSVTTLVIMFLILLITLSAAKSFSAPVKKKPRYVDGYYNCQARTNDGRETSFYEIGPSLAAAKDNAIQKCIASKGKQNCYPFAFCYAISGRVPYICTVEVDSAEFQGHGVDWNTADESARSQCSLYYPFVKCLNATSQKCWRSEEPTF